MTTKRKTSLHGREQDTRLKKENTALRKQLRELSAERDHYRRALHAWAKERISAEELQQWMKQDEEDGSLLELLGNLRRET